VAKETAAAWMNTTVMSPILERSEPDWRYSAAALQIRICDAFYLSAFLFLLQRHFPHRLVAENFANIQTLHC
jgi:hypothetical protein